MTHDYKRNGRPIPPPRFLRMIDQTISTEKRIYLICDNYATHKHLSVQRGPDKHRRFHVRFTPTSASWLRMIERFFRDLTANRGWRRKTAHTPTGVTGLWYTRSRGSRR